MRWIDKSALPPPSLQRFLEANGPLNINLDYAQGFLRKKKLLAELCDEQFHLCGYTGTPLDSERLRERVSPHGITLRAHVEHVKTQASCIQEQKTRGEVPGTKVGEDVDHRNVIAALEMRGTEVERFGAVVRTMDIVPMPPTNPACEQSFQYEETGAITPLSSTGISTISELRLDHHTLTDWRRGAIDAYLPLRENTPLQTLHEVIDGMTNPTGRVLPEFSFVVAQVASRFVDLHRVKAALETGVDIPIE